MSTEVRALTELERDLVASVSHERMSVDLEWFSDHGLRLGGTDAEREGAHYVQERLIADGIACEVEEFDSWVSYAQDREAMGPATVELLDAGETVHGKIYFFSGVTPPEGTESELVWVGTGAPSEYERLGVDVRGRIALSILSFDAPHGEPARVAGDRGALAIIIMNWSDALGSITHTSTARGVWGNPTPDDLRDGRRIPTLAVSHSDGMRLRDVALGGGHVRVRVTASAEWGRSTQPIASIPGRSEDFILVYCHQDTFGGGMTDNSTGVVGVLELARVLNRYRDALGLGVRFAWWGSHEMPYNGSTWHLDQHWDEIREHCVAVLNADSWAVGQTRDQVMTWAFAEVEGFARRCNEDVLGLPVPAEDFGAREAEQSFWCIGIPSIMNFSITDGYPDGLSYLGPWFHTLRDTIEHVDVAALRQLVELYAVMIIRLSTCRRLPFRYDELARRIADLVDELAPRAPVALRWEGLTAAAAGFLAAARRVAGVNGTAGELNRRLMRVGRILNPVVYTDSGRYGQDPSSATYLTKRLPNLQQALDELERTHDDDVLHKAWITRAVRERNRVVDALLEATEQLAEPGSTS
jgi:aminopeptidase YwaD